MTADHADSPPSAHRSRSRLRFELIAASMLVAFGLFLLPAIIFWVGTALLGPYGNGKSAGIGTFYGDFFADLASGSVRAWTLVVGPLIFISLLRLIFLRRPAPNSDTPPEDDTAPRQRRPAQTSDSRRIEPRVSLD